MRCKQDLERLSRLGAVVRTFQHLADLSFVPIGPFAEMTSFLVFEVR